MLYKMRLRQKILNFAVFGGLFLFYISFQLTVLQEQLRKKEEIFVKRVNPTFQSRTTTFRNISGTIENVENKNSDVTTTPSTTASFTPLPNARRRHIFYNRIPKCGSRSFLTVTDILAKKLNYTPAEWNFRSSEWPDKRDKERQMKLFKSFKNPTLFQRHVVFMDFKKDGFEPPIYINIVRDPVERFVSRFNYHKYGDNLGSMKVLHPQWPDINDCILKDIEPCTEPRLLFYAGWYFCGEEVFCRNGSRRSIDQAKKHMDKDYSVIGLVEEFDNTLLLMEEMLPDYFAGALGVWKEIGTKRKNETKTKKLDVLNDEARHKLKNVLLAAEYEIYNYAKEKFEHLLRLAGIVAR